VRDLQLPSGVGIGVNEPDDDELGGRVPEFGDHRIDPVGQADAKISGGQWLGPVDGRVVERRPVLTGDLHEVFEALVGDQRHPGTSSFEEGVGGDRGPVEEGVAVTPVDRRPDGL
jgi:hypothetical protein